MPDPWRAPLVVVAVCLFCSLPRAPEPLSACPHPSRVAREPIPVVTCDDPVAPILEGPARRLFRLPIDLNLADAATLESLPGIGPQRALAIIAARPFRDVGELRRVNGIGPVLLGRLRALVTVQSGAAGAQEPDRERTDSL